MLGVVWDSDGARGSTAGTWRLAATGVAGHRWFEPAGHGGARPAQAAPRPGPQRDCGMGEFARQRVGRWRRSIHDVRGRRPRRWTGFRREVASNASVLAHLDIVPSPWSRNIAGGGRRKNDLG